LAENPHIRLMAPAYGGHCAFISRHGGANRFWAEGRIMEFCNKLSAASPN
jgi:predicted alpha/beta-fold hydrolase